MGLAPLPGLKNPGFATAYAHLLYAAVYIAKNWSILPPDEACFRSTLNSVCVMRCPIKRIFTAFLQTQDFRHFSVADLLR